MPRLSDLAESIRSKNAGPFWITVDVFCGDNYEMVREELDIPAICGLLGCSAGDVKRFEIEDLRVIKVSVVRPVPQGSRGDRDMHGAQLAVLFAEMDIPAQG